MQPDRDSVTRNLEDLGSVAEIAEQQPSSGVTGSIPTSTGGAASEELDRVEIKRRRSPPLAARAVVRLNSVS